MYKPVNVNVVYHRHHRQTSTTQTVNCIITKCNITNDTITQLRTKYITYQKTSTCTMKTASTVRTQDAT